MRPPKNRAVKVPGALTAQQERFCQEIASGKTGVEAMHAAYPASRKWKKSAIYTTASMRLAEDKIARRVAELQQKSAEKAVIDGAKVIKEIGRLAFSDVRALIDSEGKTIPVHLLPDDIAAAIASIKIDEYGRVEYKFWDKGAAQDKLAKHLGLYKVDNDQQSEPFKQLAAALIGKVVGVGGVDVGDD